MLAAALFGTVGVLGFGTPAYAAPADASDSSDAADVPPPRNRIVAQGSASAATVSVAGQRHGSGQYVSEHDGDEEYTRGENTPALSLLDEGEHVVGGGLGQDVVSDGDGTSAACAGVVGSNGTIEVGEHTSCLQGEPGRIELSLGALDDLGLGDLLDELRESATPAQASQLPGPEQLPEMELVLEGEAITARCSASPGDVQGSSSPVNLTLVGVIAGERIDLVDIPDEGGSVVLPDLVDALTEELPDELGSLLDPVLGLLDSGELPELPENELLTIVTDEQVETDGQLRVNALRVSVAPPTLADVTVGSVSCGPNVQPATDQPKPPDDDEKQPPEERPRVPVAVPAGLPPSETDGRSGTAAPAASDSTDLGWGTAAVLGVAALTLGGLLHRRRRTI